MGASCETCNTQPDTNTTEIREDRPRKYHLLPAVFYNETTKQIVSKLEPLKI